MTAVIDAVGETKMDPRISVSWILGERALPAHIDPEQVALVWGGEQRTYRELRARATGLAAGLLASGLRPGDRVAAVLYNRGEIFELYFACGFAGLTLVPVNFRMTAEEVAEVLGDCGARFLVTESALADVAGRACAGIPDVRTVTLGPVQSGAEYDELASGYGSVSDPAVTECHLLLYTSGTTGRPKGVMLPHRMIIWFAMQQATLYPGMDSRTVMLVTGPTFNMSSIQEFSIPTFLVGGKVVILPSRNWSVEKMTSLIDGHRVTHTNVIPWMMEQFLAADEHQPIGFESLRFVMTGGENCATASVSRFRERWSHIAFTVGYGLTEGGIITWIRDEEISRHPASVGRAFGAQTFRVVDPNGREVRTGEVGEIVTAGPATTPGYWGAPELTADAIRDGWLWTGDLGRLDESGYLYIEGRSKDMIISGSQNIYPAEIENVLSLHPQLLEWTVIGVPDRRWGEAVCAVVVSQPGAAVVAESLIAHVREHLASYKKPKYVIFRDRLPRNPSGKVLKAELRQEFRDLEERSGRGSR
jgi:fatty-acyl-CoA synthase